MYKLCDDPVDAQLKRDQMYKLSTEVWPKGQKCVLRCPTCESQVYFVRSAMICEWVGPSGGQFIYRTIICHLSFHHTILEGTHLFTVLHVINQLWGIYYYLYYYFVLHSNGLYTQKDLKLMDIISLDICCLHIVFSPWFIGVVFDIISWTCASVSLCCQFNSLLSLPIYSTLLVFRQLCFDIFVRFLTLSCLSLYYYLAEVL